MSSCRRCPYTEKWQRLEDKKSMSIIQNDKKNHAELGLCMRTRGTLLQEFWSDQWYMVNIWKNHDQRQLWPCISDQNIRWPGEVQRAGKQRTQEGGWWTRGYCWWTATFELLTNQEFELWPDISNQCKTTISNSLSSASHHPEFRWTLIG